MGLSNRSNLTFNLINVSTIQSSLIFVEKRKKNSNQLLYQCETLNSTDIKYIKSTSFCVSIMPFIRGSAIVAPWAAMVGAHRWFCPWGVKGPCCGSQLSQALCWWTHFSCTAALSSYIRSPQPHALARGTSMPEVQREFARAWLANSLLISSNFWISKCLKK